MWCLKSVHNRVMSLLGQYAETEVVRPIGSIRRLSRPSGRLPRGNLYAIKFTLVGFHGNTRLALETLIGVFERAGLSL